MPIWQNRTDAWGDKQKQLLENQNLDRGSDRIILGSLGRTINKKNRRHFRTKMEREEIAERRTSHSNLTISRNFIATAGIQISANQ